MKSLWKKEFRIEQTSNTAERILQEQCDFLTNQTGGKIIAKVAIYDETIEPDSPFVSVFAHHTTIQDKLGEVGDATFIFEFYITSRATPNYKYRVMFIEYEISFYPVTIFLDEEIASEIGEKPEIECLTQEEFEEKLELIFNSSKLERIISNLLIITAENLTKF